MRSLLKAARAKKIDRLAAAYAVAGWFLVQGAAIGLPLFEAPHWALRAFIAVILAGFPLTLGIAWVLAPEPSASKRDTQRTTSTDLALLMLLSGVIVIAAVQFVFEFWYTPAIVPSGTVASRVDAPVPAKTSIAVLPFANMSGDPNKEYFSDGISEQLLNNLASTPALLVAARTSSFAFKGKNVDIKEIAQTLHVRAVLEGSVREEGNHLRISAQLIDAANGYSLWSKTYDRELTGILSVQDEIARDITSALTNRILGGREARPGKPASMNPEAYRKYLEGQHDLATRTKEAVDRAIELFKQVTELQPDFADGFAALALAYIAGYPTFSELRERRPLATAAAEQALKLDPDNLVALFAHLSLAIKRLDWPTAGEDVRRMRAINPNNASVLFGVYWYYSMLGFPEQSIAALRRGLELDPLSVLLKLNLADELTAFGQAEEARTLVMEVQRQQPDNQLAVHERCFADTRLGDFEDARRAMNQLATAKPVWLAKDCAFHIAIKSGHVAEARALADEMASQFPNILPYSRMLSIYYFSLHDTDKALDWLQYTIEKDYGVASAAALQTEVAELRKTPRGKALWQRPKFRAWQAAHDRAAADFPIPE